jgi:hypothetical protein
LRGRRPRAHVRAELGKRLHLRNGALLVVCGDAGIGRILEIVEPVGVPDVYPTLGEALGVGV